MGQRGKELKIELVRILSAAYKARSRQVNVITSDPRTKRELPSVAVNRPYDSEAKRGLSNVYGQSRAEDR